MDQLLLTSFQWLFCYLVQFVSNPMIFYPRITQFVILGPLGVTNSEIFSVGENLFASNITWMPSEGQSGKNIICYYAVDTVG